MPIYEYICKSCDAKFEQLQRTMNETAAPKCPSCASTKTEKALSVFAVGSEGPRRSSAPMPQMCQRCGGEGPCPSGF